MNYFVWDKVFPTTAPTTTPGKVELGQRLLAILSKWEIRNSGIVKVGYQGMKTLSGGIGRGLKEREKSIQFAY